MSVEESAVVTPVCEDVHEDTDVGEVCCAFEGLVTSYNRPELVEMLTFLAALPDVALDAKGVLDYLKAYKPPVVGSASSWNDFKTAMMNFINGRHGKLFVSHCLFSCVEFVADGVLCSGVREMSTDVRLPG